MLRSLNSGDASLILGRKTLGASGDVTIELLMDSGSASFDGKAWSVTSQKLAIFDSTFIGQNVYSGEIVDIEHKRNLYRVIIGAAGVSMAEEDTQLAADSRTKTGEISTTEKALKLHFPAEMTTEEFVGLVKDPDIDAKIAEQERAIEAIRQAGDIAARASLSEISLPEFPAAFDALLMRTIDDIAGDAEKRVAEHLAAHAGMDGKWIADRTAHAVGDTCPFCGQSIEGLPLVAAYRACTFDAALLDLPESVSADIRNLGAEALALLAGKAASPLESIKPGDGFAAAKKAYTETCTCAAAVSTATKAVNSLIAAKKTVAAAADLKIDRPNYSG